MMWADAGLYWLSIYDTIAGAAQPDDAEALQEFSHFWRWPPVSISPTTALRPPSPRLRAGASRHFQRRAAFAAALMPRQLSADYFAVVFAKSTPPRAFSPAAHATARRRRLRPVCVLRFRRCRQRIGVELPPPVSAAFGHAAAFEDGAHDSHDRGATMRPRFPLRCHDQQ